MGGIPILVEPVDQVAAPKARPLKKWTIQGLNL